MDLDIIIKQVITSNHIFNGLKPITRAQDVSSFALSVKEGVLTGLGSGKVVGSTSVSHNLIKNPSLDPRNWSSYALYELVKLRARLR